MRQCSSLFMGEQMDQSRSNSGVAGGALSAPCDTPGIVLPKRKLTIEFLVGLFTLAGVACAGWLAIGLGGVQWFNTDTYDVFAEFDNISGLKTGASVEIAGVPVGEVSEIVLKDPAAKVTLRIKKSVQIRDDDIASIRTKGIIGDRYVKLSRGGSDMFVAPNGTMTETESVVDLEDLIGKFVHNFGSDKSDEENSKKAEGDK
jgi:phospholipid/cholesterol/gamma-HCH transport system substrate-binding protein